MNNNFPEIAAGGVWLSENPPDHKALIAFLIPRSQIIQMSSDYVMLVIVSWGLRVIVVRLFRGPPDISSLVPIGPKYAVKWTAPLLQVQVVEVGQETPQRKESILQQSSSRRLSSSNSQGWYF